MLPIKTYREPIKTSIESMIYSKMFWETLKVANAYHNLPTLLESDVLKPTLGNTLHNVKSIL
jgi:hypothetical protein